VELTGGVGVGITERCLHFGKRRAAIKRVGAVCVAQPVRETEPVMPAPPELSEPAMVSATGVRSAAASWVMR